MFCVAAGLCEPLNKISLYNYNYNKASINLYPYPLRSLYHHYCTPPTNPHTNVCLSHSSSVFSTQLINLLAPFSSFTLCAGNLSSGRVLLDMSCFGYAPQPLAYSATYCICMRRSDTSHSNSAHSDAVGCCTSLHHPHVLLMS